MGESGPFAQLAQLASTVLALVTFPVATVDTVDETRWSVEEADLGPVDIELQESGISFCPEKSVRFGGRAPPRAGRGIDFSNVVSLYDSARTYFIKNCPYGQFLILVRAPGIEPGAPKLSVWRYTT